MKHLCSFMILMLLPIMADGQWAILDKADLSTVEYDGIVYTGTAVVICNESGVFRSTDNGITWVRSVSGLDSIRTGGSGLTYLESPRNELWLNSSGSLYKSTNHGESWTKASINGLPDGAWTDRLGRTGSRLFTFISYWDNDLSSLVNRIAYSDDGSNWIPGVILSLNNTSWWEMLGEDNERALFLIEYPQGDGQGKLWTTTTGNSVQEFPLTGLPGTPEMNDRSLSIEPEGDYLIFTDENGGGYYRFNFGTQTWEVKVNGIELAGYSMLMTFGAHSLSNVMIATVLFSDPGMNLVMKLFTSSDHGDTWTAVEDPGVEYPLFEKEIIVAGSNRIIGSLFNSYMAYSDNLGQTWAKATGIQAGDFGMFRGLANGTLITVTQEQEKGILKSTDNGETWSDANGNLVNFQGIYIIDDIRVAGNYIYAMAAEDPFSEKPYMFVNTDLEANIWTKLTSAPDSAKIKFSGMHGLWPIFLFSDSEGNGTFQMTKDAGANWINITPAIGPLAVDRVLGMKGNGPGGMLFLFAEKNAKTRVYLSKNDGTSFYDITSNLEGSANEIVISNQWDWDAVPNIIGSFRADNKFMLAVWDNTVFPRIIHFYMLNEVTELWEMQGGEGIPGDYNVGWHSLKFNGGVWYLSTSVALFASIDNCATWLPVWNNEGFPVGAFTGSFVMNNYGAYIGTRGAGIWRAPLTAPILNTLDATDITDTSAASGATIVSTGGLPFGNKGLCWSLSSGPTISDNVIWAGKSWESFTDTLKMLTPNTDYFVRALVQSPKGGGQPVYGNEITFRTDNTTRIVSEKNGEVKIFPNPSDGRFSVVAESEWILTIMDLKGRVLSTQKMSPGTNIVTLENATPGLYFLKLTDTTNASQVINLIVK